jgi:hypothetical protein
MSFKYLRADFKIGNVQVTNDGALLKEFLSQKIEDALVGGSAKSDLEKSFASSLGSAAGPAVASLFDLRFASILGSDRNEKLKDSSYLRSGRHSKCTSTPCALYVMKH